MKKTKNKMTEELKMKEERTSGKVLAEIVNTGAYEECSRESHERWMKTKLEQGWTYGPTRDNVNKKNPFMVDYQQLPEKELRMNRVTPYAVVNFLRVDYPDKNLLELKRVLGDLKEGKDQKELQKLSEYVHSHFIAAQLAIGETAGTRNDMTVYESLSPETQSWDSEIAKQVIDFVMRKIKVLEAEK